MTKRIKPFFGGSQEENKFFGGGTKPNRPTKTNRLPSAFPSSVDEHYPEDAIPDFDAAELKERDELIRSYHRHRVYWINDPGGYDPESDAAIERLAQGKFRRVRTSALREHAAWSYRLGLIGRYYTATSRKAGKTEEVIRQGRADAADKLNDTKFKTWPTARIEKAVATLEKSKPAPPKPQTTPTPKKPRKGLWARLKGRNRKPEPVPVAKTRSSLEEREARKFDRLVAIYAELHQVPKRDVLKF